MTDFSTALKKYQKDVGFRQRESLVCNATDRFVKLGKAKMVREVRKHVDEFEARNPKLSLASDNDDDEGDGKDNKNSTSSTLRSGSNNNKMGSTASTIASGGSGGKKGGEPGMLSEEDEKAIAKEARIAGEKAQDDEFVKLQNYVRKPCTPLAMHLNYGDASMKILGKDTFRRDADRMADLYGIYPSKPRFPRTFPNGAGYPYTIMEPIFVLPTTQPTFPNPDKREYDHPPLLRQASMPALQAHRKENLLNVFKNAKGITPKYTKGRLAADTYIGTVSNQADKAQCFWEQRQYDARKGYGFCSRQLNDQYEHFVEVLNAEDGMKNVDEKFVKWMNHPNPERWTEMQRKTYDILTRLHLVFTDEKKLASGFFRQTEKYQEMETAAGENWFDMGGNADDFNATGPPAFDQKRAKNLELGQHPTVSGMSMDWKRLLYNLEVVYKVVNQGPGSNTPDLRHDEMHEFMICLGENFSNQISLVQFMKVMSRFRILYNKMEEKRMKEEQRLMPKRIKAAKKQTADHFQKLHWQHRTPIFTHLKQNVVELPKARVM